MVSTITALVTGSEGFVGKYLCDYISSKGYRVAGFDLKLGDDIRDYDQVHLAIEKHEPDLIFHLAALAYVPESGSDSRRGIDTNVVGTANVLEAVRQTGLASKVLLAGTSEEYGYRDHGEGPLTELTQPKPTTLYGASKLAAGQLGLTYARAYGMPVVVTRAFNHIGPGQSHRYAVSAFARRIVEVEKGWSKVVKHGNLESVRNYSSVKDIVRAYWLAIQQPSDVYNLCSEYTLSAQEIMNILISQAHREIITELDESLFRVSAPVKFPKPSCEKFSRLTAWGTAIPITETLHDILDYWRENL